MLHKMHFIEIGWCFNSTCSVACPKAFIKSVSAGMTETDDSNYSGRQRALLQQDKWDLSDAQSSCVLINTIRLAC